MFLYPIPFYMLYDMFKSNNFGRVVNCYIKYLEFNPDLNKNTVSRVLLNREPLREPWGFLIMTSVDTVWLHWLSIILHILMNFHPSVTHFLHFIVLLLLVVNFCNLDPDLINISRNWKLRDNSNFIFEYRLQK